MDVKRTFFDGLELFGGAVRAVPPDAWDRPTPCAEWNARQLVGHLVSVLELAGATIRGDENPPGSTAPAELGADPAAEWPRAAARTRAEVERADLDEVRTTMFGEVPLRQALGFPAVDLYLHTWDLGRAHGRRVALPDHVLTWAEQFLRQIPEEALRSPNAFGPEQPAPEGADATERLMAFLGRTP
ncbi:TIGR03086 family metal-binding protein [Salinifilum ghardaiensis]